ncbi:MAG: 23S rRNA (uracil(1939)-C(5))-methyltransferase RlmD [Deltaproteobacteria bacterium]|nr:23S rRNA (uracil(1939)-C(5))-methyltransferase RlmD [Deltaproteobacteria bacterium]
MVIKKRDEIELEITGMAFGGRGITRHAGLAVFVDGAVPGDKVLARIIKKKKSYAEARALVIISPSSDRVDPPCPYSGSCGGCKWQFLSYGKQLEYKRQHVAEAIERIGGISGVPVHPVIGSEKIFGYRNKMEFSCADRRWLLPHELGDPDIPPNIPIDFALGLHVPGTFHKVLDMDACLIMPDSGSHILKQAGEWMKTSDLPPYGLRTQIGFWRFLMLRHSVAEDSWLVNIVTASEEKAEIEAFARQLYESCDNVATVVNNVTSRKSSVAIGEYERVITGPGVLSEKLGKYHFDISANSFFQTNTRGAEKLYDIVAKFAELTGVETVVDLYCGTGTIAIWLSELAASVVGIEINESAVSDAMQNCEKNGIENCRFICGDIREVISGLSIHPDVMIIDPPRSGMHKDVVNAILSLAPARIVYVSCNPATLARDVELLAESYDIAEIQPVDMFPHTFHIEAVARLEKKKEDKHGNFI